MPEIDKKRSVIITVFYLSGALQQMPGIINLNCFDSAACVRCFLCFVSCETTYCCCVFLLQTKVALLFSVYCKRTEFCCVVVASEWCFDDLICCKHTKGFCIVEYCKKSNFGQKTKRENGKKHKHWQKKYTSV